MSEKKETKTDPAFGLVVVIGWILPLFGAVYGPGTFWQYVLWLLIGTVVIFGYLILEEKREETP